MSSAQAVDASTFWDDYEEHVSDRKDMGIDPLPLNAEQTAQLCEIVKDPSLEPRMDSDKILHMLQERVPPGVDEAAYVKAAFLAAITKGEATSPLVSKEDAAKLLGGMLGGYNIQPLVALLDADDALAAIAADGLCHTLLMFDAFHDVEEKAQAGNEHAKRIMQSWADAEWFTAKPKVQEKYTLTVFKVPGETNTDDLSPAQDAWSRPDIPLHALAMLKMARPGIEPDVQGEVGPVVEMEKLKSELGHPLVYVGDVVGTGSSRKSATNSVLWFMGDDWPGVPNKRTGGFCFGEKIAPIFYNTMEDAGAMPIEMPVSKMSTGQVIDVYPYEGVVKDNATGEVISEFELKTQVLLDEVRAGGRIPLIVGRGLTARARESLGLSPSEAFRVPEPPPSAGTSAGYTLGQKMVGQACGMEGVRPGQYCEPRMTTVGSQDTTGPMTRDELKDLACLGFSADLVMQSFCHTAAYPKPVDVVTHHTLPDFIRTRGGVSLRPGDGIIHSWLNRMLLPDTVGTGGDSHTRFPIGVSFPAGSGLVAFAGATGVMPLDMPESVLVRFTGEMQPGITLRDLVHAIPYQAIKEGHLTVPKQGKINVFSGKVLEIEGDIISKLKCEQAFELSDAAAERSAAACTIKLDKEPIIEYLNSNMTMLKWMIAEGYGDRRTIERRVNRMQKWIDDGAHLMERDADAEYAAVIEIDMNKLTEPVLCAPNDPDDARLLSEVCNGWEAEHMNGVQESRIDEVFIGSCMTNIGHFRAAGKLLDETGKPASAKLWIAPPTKMDAAVLTEEGYYGIFGKAGARMEMPGCSLCMGNQARVEDNCHVVSTSTRNFPNRLGAGANVFLASAELASVAAILGRLPTPDEYLEYSGKLDATAADTYRYLNFDQVPSFIESASSVQMSEEMKKAAESMAL
jgi:aconitate hydratase 2/2-methylisocitrate dehydratase